MVTAPTMTTVVKQWMRLWDHCCTSMVSNVTRECSGDHGY